MTQLCIHFQLRGKAEAFPQARVEVIRDGAQLPLGLARQIGAFGHMQTEELIRILIGASLSRA